MSAPDGTATASASPNIVATSSAAAATPRPTSRVASCPDSVDCDFVQDAIGKIDPSRMDQHMRALASFGSRDPRHPGHAKAVAYIKEQLAPLASRGLNVESQRTAYQSTPLENIFASIGTDHGGWVLISAHYDSIANRTPGWRPTTDPAPGADDNATGTAALLEFARIISEFPEHALYNRVVLAFFDGEELFYKGSAAYLQTLDPPRYQATVNIDMVGFNPIADRLDLIWWPSSAELRDQVKAVNERYEIGLELVEVEARDGSTSGYILDSAPFGLAGIPSVTLAERYGPPDATYPGNNFFHTVNDTPDKVTNPRLWLKAAKLTLAVALERLKFPDN